MFFGRRDTLLLSILTFVTTVAWIAFDIHHAYVTSTIQQEVEAQLVPITPTFDQSTLKRLKQRRDIAPLETAIASEAARTFTVGSVTPVATKAGTP